MNRQLTAADAAQILQLPLSSVWGLVARQELPHYRIGRLVRIDEGALQRWIEKRALSADEAFTNHTQGVIERCRSRRGR